MPVDYSRYPRPESVAFFEQSIRGHNRVSGMKKISEYYYEISRVGMSNVNVLVTNYYTLGYSELLDIISTYPDVDCVITISNWNGYTDQAYEEGKRRRIGVFIFQELFGALNCAEPYQYIRSVDRDDN